MYKLTKEAEQWEPLPGIPWRDMEDDEFADAEKAYAEQGFPAHALRSSGYFEHVESKAPAKKEAE